MEVAQLIDLKTFTVEFEERLKLLSNENDHLKKKVQDYRRRYHDAQKESAQVEQENIALTTKAEGYEKLVQKLESELEKNIKKAQQTAGQMTLSSLNRGQL
jgi:hemerythrin-like domain-containing protein